MRRILGITAPVLAVVVVLGLTAGGWYYTDQLLPVAVGSDEPTYDTEVVGVDADEGRITLAATEGDLVELARLGFWTATATLELGEVTATDADSVTRTATLLDGDWPEEGEQGAARIGTFRGDPQEALDLAFDDVPVEGPDGVLPAWLVPGDDTAATHDPATVALLVHGRGSTRQEMHRTLRTVHEAGLDALVISLRNDPEAPRDPDGWGRFGDTEWEDLQAAVDHLVADRDPERLLLVGSSQGGSIVLGWLRRGEHTDRAVAAVLVSPLVSMHGTLVVQARDRGIPDAAIPPLLWSTKLLATWRSGIRFDRLEHAAEDVVEAYRVPMLVAHGSGDSTVPSEASAELAEQRPDLVQLEEYPDVEHVREWNADPERFEADLGAFLDDVLG
jgi:uncharacterized protein